MDDLARFMSKTRVEDRGYETPCRVWTGTLHKFGYGVFKVSTPRRRNVTAHRWVFQVAHGVSLEPSQHVLHRCDIPECVEIAHLFQGSQLDNMRDMVAKGRHWHQTTPPKSACRCGTEYVTRPSGLKVCPVCTRAAVKRYKQKREV